MDYSFENLGPERFQEFCQALLNKKYADMQVLPVGQPDGGRDFVAYLRNSAQKEFLVFQIKYVRNPNTISSVHQWLVDIVKDEAPKVRNLIPKGAKQYVLMTNVKGTGHLDVGSIDRLNKILEQSLDVPALCWWRDDIARMLEADPIFKWSFPEILSGQDILNSVIFHLNFDNKEKRENVIRAYLADQFEIDNEVKFKQIELQNTLLDLFTDVPIRVKKVNETDRYLKQTLYRLRYYDLSTVSHELFDLEEGSTLNAAAFLLNPVVQETFQRVLLEGGPGQGKSTISQYVCQVHRIRLLNKLSELHKLPDKHKNVPVRLPFKIDLRDVAAWVERRNPYVGILNDEYFNSNWQKSFESFLVGHIYYHSKIDQFGSNDLISICRLSSVLFVLDGFDEIADLKIREEIVEFINKGLSRIGENSKAIQVIITSRPAAFSNSIGFPVALYPHFELTDLTPELTKEYVDKWIKSRRLVSREASEIRRLVDEKLILLPHLRDLARSPMQLAILMSLLNTRGESLPNKRTALYDSYVELFFNRESEKSSMIRENRDLIIAIHEYLAWILHSEAELYKNSGRMLVSDLKSRITGYLEAHGHPIDITDKLFSVMEERVCALVSRIIGTFEFEVQPLREYFCAKYLYKTSPYSPSGSEKTGTKPDRFDAIAKNVYWQNVVRFFAGCFDVGELPMLIQKLYDLQNDAVLRSTNYPRLLTSQLLSDWVFTQYPKLLKDVVRIIVDGVNLGKILNQELTAANEEPIRLPLECGRRELVEECFSQLVTFPPSDYAADLIGLLNNNPYNNFEYWKSRMEGLPRKLRVKWVEYGYELRIIHRVDDVTLLELIEESAEDGMNCIQRIVGGSRIDILDKNLALKQKALAGMLSGELFFHERSSKSHSLLFLSSCHQPGFLHSFVLNTGRHAALPFLTYLESFVSPYYEHKRHPKSIIDFQVEDHVDERIQEYLNAIRGTITDINSSWHTNIEPWDLVVERARELFGDQTLFNMTSVIAAGIKERNSTFEDFDDLHNTQLSLTKRMRCARMKSGNIKYWERQFSYEKNIEFTLLAFFSWATPKAILTLADLVMDNSAAIERHQILKLVSVLERVTGISRFTPVQERSIVKSLKGISATESFTYLVSTRFGWESRAKFIYSHLSDAAGQFPDVIDLKLGYLIRSFINDPSSANTLEEIKSVYEKVIYTKHDYFFYHRDYEKAVLPYDVARVIMDDCRYYPRILASIAERSCRVYANENVTPVGMVAARDRWFEYST